MSLLDILQANQDPPTMAQQILQNRQMSGAQLPPQFQMAGMQQPQMQTTQMPPMMAPYQPSMNGMQYADTQNMIGRLTNPNYYRPITPQELDLQGAQAQLAGVQGQNAMIQGQGEMMKNNIMSQTGLPLAQADLQQKLLANQIQQQTGMQGAQADIAQKNAMAGYYGNALQRDIAEKAFDYANNPQNAQARMMALYMQSLSGLQPQNANMSTPSMGAPMGGIPQVPASALQPGVPAQRGPIPNPPAPDQLNLPQQLHQNGQAQQPQGGGFNPMGAMLAKSLGMTDMQIGPNGQPMPIPGSMKIENGSVISFDANGKPQNNIPVNPRAQGLFEGKLQDINDKLEQLHAIGGTVEEGGGFIHNKATQAAASDLGQYALQGTPAQSLRDDIQADVKQALPLYMEAFGITPGMERAQAAQQMLQDAIGGAVGKSRQHLQANLSNLSATAGTGELAKKLAAQASPKSSGIQYQPGMVRNGYRFNGGDPTKQENWEPVQ